MTTELCLVTTWKREELLYLCLEAIRKQSDMPIVVFSDRGVNTPELAEACCVSPIADLWVRTMHKRFGNSWNVLTAIMQVLHDCPDLQILHLVEDDTIVHPGWFAWARQQLAVGIQPQARDLLVQSLTAAVCARIHGDPATVWYESPCVSWNVQFLAQCLKEIPDGYLECESRGEMQKLVDAHFSQSRYRYGSPEQDGFFLRCVEKLKLRTKFPEKCMASHVGAWGYNRPEGAPRPEGATFHERVEWCRKLLHDKHRRTELFGQRITELEFLGMDGQ